LVFLASSLLAFSSDFFFSSSAFLASFSSSLEVLGGVSGLDRGVHHPFGVGVGIGVGLSFFGVGVPDGVDGVDMSLFDVLDGGFAVCVVCDVSSNFAQIRGMVIVSVAHFITSQPTHIVISLMPSPIVSAHSGLVIAFDALSIRHFHSALFLINLPPASVV
jgi:hypothetical protein